MTVSAFLPTDIWPETLQTNRGYSKKRYIEFPILEVVLIGALHQNRLFWQYCILDRYRILVNLYLKKSRDYPWNSTWWTGIDKHGRRRTSKRHEACWRSTTKFSFVTLTTWRRSSSRTFAPASADTVMCLWARILWWKKLSRYVL